MKTKRDTSAAPRRRRSRAEWLAEAQGWRSSGKPADDYAAEHDLCASTLTWWASQLGVRAIRGAGTAAAPAPPTSPRFLPVRVVGVDGKPDATDPRSAALVEIVLLNGRRVRVDGGMKPEALGRLLEIVEGGCQC